MSLSKDALGKMTDTKWHIGYVTMDPSDTRRDRRKCVNFRKKTKTCAYGVPCQGSSHCINYREPKTQKNKIPADSSSFEKYADYPDGFLISKRNKTQTHAFRKKKTKAKPNRDFALKSVLKPRDE